MLPKDWPEVQPSLVDLPLVDRYLLELRTQLLRRVLNAKEIDHSIYWPWRELISRVGKSAPQVGSGSELFEKVGAFKKSAVSPCWSF